jgi:carbon-monoxide dehydrogenase medium subunit
LFVGAAVPVSRIVASSLVRSHALALVEAADLIAGPQVRNVATLGGNVAHALPAADGTIALMALEATCEIAGPDGSRQEPIGSLFLGPGKSALKEGRELLVGFRLAKQTKGQASAFKRIMRPQGPALPILNTAVWLARRGGKVADVRIAVGPGGPVPFRALTAEQTLRSHSFTPVVCERTLTALLSQVQFRTSPQRASADYRRHLAGLLMQEALETAWERAGNL